MTDTSIAAAYVATNDFRVGSVIRRSGAVLSRHFLTFLIVAVTAESPTLLMVYMQPTELIGPSEAFSLGLVATLVDLLLMVLGTLSYAIILHAAFQDMRRRPVSLAESVKVGSSRFLPLIGIAFVQKFVILPGMILLTIPVLFLYEMWFVGLLLFLIIPSSLLYTMWFVGVPACVVERLGPWTSLRRSRELTKGFRWRVFALALPLFVVNAGSSNVIEPVLTAIAVPIVGLAGQLIWAGVTAAFTSIVFAVTYYDLRVIKEGVDIEQITAVFD